MVYFFTFNLPGSLFSKWVSCRQHIVGSCLFIYYENVSLLIHICRTSTFKVIIDVFVLIPTMIVITLYHCQRLFSPNFSGFKLCLKKHFKWFSYSLQYLFNLIQFYLQSIMFHLYPHFFPLILCDIVSYISLIHMV